MAQEPFPPPVKCAVSLAFDGGMESHLTKVLPLLNQRGLRGTFYVTASSVPLVAARDLQALLTHLESQKALVWTAPVIDVVRHIGSVNASVDCPVHGEPEQKEHA